MKTLYIRKAETEKGVVKVNRGTQQPNLRKWISTKKKKIIVATVRGCIDNTYTILTKTLDSNTKISMAHSGESHMASRINNGVHRRKNQQFCHQVRQSRIKLAQVLPSQQSTMKVRHFLYKLYTNQRIVFFSKLDYYVPFCHSSSFSPL